MQDINNYIKETDTDNVILNKLKELGTKLTGQENVQGETVADVLDFINSNYSGGGSGSKSITIKYDNYTDIKDEDGISFSIIDVGLLLRESEKTAYIEFVNTRISVASSDVSTNKGIHFASLNDDETYRLFGLVPCEIKFYDKNNNYAQTSKIGFVSLSGSELYLECNDWSFLSDEPLNIDLSFRGVVDYDEYV